MSSFQSPSALSSSVFSSGASCVSSTSPLPLSECVGTGVREILTLAPGVGAADTAAGAKLKPEDAAGEGAAAVALVDPKAKVGWEAGAAAGDAWGAVEPKAKATGAGDDDEGNSDFGAAVLEVATVLPVGGPVLVLFAEAVVSFFFWSFYFTIKLC